MNDATQILRRLSFKDTLPRRLLTRYRHRGLGDEDCFLMSYPRSGMTWLRFMLTEVFTGEPAEFGSVSRTARYIGDHLDGPRVVGGRGRLIFSHEPLDVGPKRVVYIARDPRAVAVSEYKWLRRRGLFSGSFEEFLDRFLEGGTNPWGSWGSHVEHWLESTAAKQGLMYVVRFERLREEPEVVLSEVVRAFGLEPDESTIESAVGNNSVDRMRQKEERASSGAFAPGVDRGIRFINTGSAEGWKERLNPAQSAAISGRFGAAMTRVGYEFD
jgi:hypothetical protein